MAMRRGCDGWCLASWRARLITVVLWWHSDTLTLVVENQLALCVCECVWKNLQLFINSSGTQILKHPHTHKRAEGEIERDRDREPTRDTRL